MRALDQCSFVTKIGQGKAMCVLRYVKTVCVSDLVARLENRMLARLVACKKLRTSLCDAN